MNIKNFRIIALCEGFSYLFLLFLGMPLKYGWDILWPNKILGIFHGLLTLIFCFFLAWLWYKNKLKAKLSIAVLIASIIPFGAFIIDHKLTSSYSEK